MIRAMEVALSIALSIWLLVIIPRLAREFIDAVLEQMREEVSRSHAVTHSTLRDNVLQGLITVMRMFEECVTSHAESSK